MSKVQVGILGLGMYLPPEIRRNDWWEPHIVAGWMEQRDRARAPARAAATPGEARILAALAEQATDPFQHAVERHVMAPGTSVFDLAEQAGRAAIARAGIDAAQIDLLLTHTVAPDYLLSNSACAVHARLGLPAACLAIESEASTYSFLAQLVLAEGMIAAGRATCALLVQACGASRLVDPADPSSPLFGDGATAAVIGRVAPGRGLLGAVHRVDGRYPDTLIASSRGGTWFDAAPSTIHIGNPARMQEVLLQTADICKESIQAALDAAGHRAADVDFLCMHQGTPWLRTLLQEYVDLGHARSVETFTRTGYLFAAILPSGLAFAEAEGLLAPDDLVVLTGGGMGMIYGALVLRWGGA